MSTSDLPRQDYDARLKKTLNNTFNKPGLTHLYELFSGTADDPAAYLFDPKQTSDLSADRLSEALSSGALRDATQQFLDHLDDLRDARIGKTRAVEYLEDEYSIPDELVEDVHGNAQRLLRLVYAHVYEDDLSMVRQKFTAFLYSTQYYVENTDTVYTLDETFDFDKLATEAHDFEADRNHGRKRAFRAKTKATDEELVFQLFEEIAPQRNRVFGFRTKDETTSPPPHPDLTRTTTYRIKSLGLRVSDEGDRTKFVFSDDPRDRWQRTLEAFFLAVFEIQNPFDRLDRQLSATAKTIEQTATEAASDPGKQAIEVIEEVQTIIDARIDTVLTDLEASDELDGDDIAELRTYLDRIELCGVRVTDDRQTGTSFFELRPRNDLLRPMEFVEGLDEAMLGYLEKADDESIRPILHVKEDGGASDEIILQDGDWSSLRGPLTDESADALNIFFNGINE